MDIEKRLNVLIRGGYSCIQLLTPEEERASAIVSKVASSLGFKLWQWSVTAGLIDPTGDQVEKTADPGAALSEFLKVEKGAGGAPNGQVIKNQSIVVLRDFHMFFKVPNPVLIRKMKDAITLGRATHRHLVIIGCQLNMQPELEKEITVIQIPLPTREELGSITDTFSSDTKIKLSADQRDAVIEALAGMTTIEAEDAIASSIVETKTMTPSFIFKTKTEQLKKSGLLEVIDPSGVNFSSVGGLHSLKDWIAKRKNAFTHEAREYGLPMLKGVVMFGVQGAGKSFASMAIASELECPLIALDAGKLFAGIVGASEENVRSVIAQAEAFGKCVLRIDEIDKGFSGMNSGHVGDSGVTRRVIGTFLTWMQDKKSPVFIVATANDITQLPPELLRKGRWDELFFIDLPTEKERIEIWGIQISRHKRNPKNFDLEKLADATSGWTGAEIESLFVESLYSAFVDKKEPTTDLILNLSGNTMPLSKTMGERISSLRKWAQGRARSAS